MIIASVHTYIAVFGANVDLSCLPLLEHRTNYTDYGKCRLPPNVYYSEGMSTEITDNT